MADEIGIWFMFWTPPATTTSLVPLMTAWAAKWTACCADPHWRSTVVPGTSSGRPAASQQVRAMSPAWGPMVSHAAEDHVLDGARVDVVAIDDGPKDVGADVGRMDARQASLLAADRRADGVDDVRFGHGSGSSCVEGGGSPPRVTGGLRPPWGSGQAAFTITEEP